MVSFENFCNAGAAQGQRGGKSGEAGAGGRVAAGGMFEHCVGRVMDWWWEEAVGVGRRNKDAAGDGVASWKGGWSWLRGQSRA